MSKKLKNHHFCASQSGVKVDWKITSDQIIFDFEITNYQANTNNKFSVDYTKNWGLWDFDVVEVFIKRDDSDSYLEVQSSPLNAPFALIIQKPRQVFHPPKQLGLQLNNSIQNKSWKSTIALNLDSIPGKGSVLVGNCFACLGPKEQREYFALNINTEDTPDFHRPELFSKLGEIK